MKAMISQPMNGKTDDEIITTRDKAIKILESKGYEVINTFFEDEWCADGVLENNGIVNKPLWFLAKSLEKMSECEAIYFCKGWENTRGCSIEHSTAFAYGLKIIYEEEE